MAKAAPVGSSDSNSASDTNHLGRIYKVQLECWRNLLIQQHLSAREEMRGQFCISVIPVFTGMTENCSPRQISYIVDSIYDL